VSGCFSSPFSDAIFAADGIESLSSMIILSPATIFHILDHLRNKRVRSDEPIPTRAREREREREGFDH
jgi:hypothetical protein